MRAASATLFAGIALLVATDRGVAEDKEDAAPKPKPAKTLLEWRIGKEKEEEKNGNGANGNGANGSGADEEEEDEIVTDRPDFTEASSTVGRGRIQLESGYTFFYDRANGTRSSLHSYPEILLRIGMFADWFELRLGQNFGSELTAETDGSREKANGAFDLYLGTKLWLAEQKGILPETAVILQMTVPTGSSHFTSGEVLPGVNLLYGWDVVKDCLSLAGSTQANRVRGTHALPTLVDVEAGPVVEVDHSYLLFAQSLSVGYTLTKKLGAYTEWFCLIPSSALDPETGPEHYFDGGFTYKITPNLQLDIRAGVGLNEHAVDFFGGAGFAIRR